MQLCHVYLLQTDSTVIEETADNLGVTNNNDALN